MEKAELIITAMQQRIGELVSNYETQVAFLRAEVTQLTNQIKEMQDYSNSLDKLGVDNGK
jgi:phage host-nuclease inhibitor protein Gam